jgi:cbb3-type cytochrome oxidase maturation protein
MNIILIMIPISLLLFIAAIGVFFWSVNHGQFEDMDSPGLLPMSDNLPDEDDEGA